MYSCMVWRIQCQTLLSVAQWPWEVADMNWSTRKFLSKKRVFVAARQTERRGRLPRGASWGFSILGDIQKLSVHRPEQPTGWLCFGQGDCTRWCSGVPANLSNAVIFLLLMCCETKLYRTLESTDTSCAWHLEVIYTTISIGTRSVLHTSLTLWPLHSTSAPPWKTNKKMLFHWNSQVPFVAVGQIVRTQGCLSRGGGINQVDPLGDPQGKGKILTTGRTWNYRALLPWCVGLEKVTKISDEDRVCLLALCYALSWGRAQKSSHACFLCPHTACWHSFLIANVSKRYQPMIK